MWTRTGILWTILTLGFINMYVSADDNSVADSLVNTTVLTLQHTSSTSALPSTTAMAATTVLVPTTSTTQATTQSSATTTRQQSQGVSTTTPQNSSSTQSKGTEFTVTAITSVATSKPTIAPTNPPSKTSSSVTQPTTLIPSSSEPSTSLKPTTTNPTSTAPSTTSGISMQSGTTLEVIFSTTDSVSSSTPSSSAQPSTSTTPTITKVPTTQGKVSTSTEPISTTTGSPTETVSTTLSTPFNKEISMEAVQDMNNNDKYVQTCQIILRLLKIKGNCSFFGTFGMNPKFSSVNLSVEPSLAQNIFDGLPSEDDPPAMPITLIAILSSCGALVLILFLFALYCMFHHRSYRKNQQHLTEELQTVENGYHDNPTLEVMEVQPEMQEKKLTLNGEFNDSWIVPIDNLAKEDILDEEDTHL